MDVVEFLARSEWPLVAGAAIWVLRHPLKHMLDRINPTKLDAWGFKAEFEKTLDKVDALVPKTDETPPVATPAFAPEPQETTGNRLDRPMRPLPNEEPIPPKPSHRDDPYVIIMQSWRRLEASIRRLSNRLHPPDSSGAWTPLSIEEAAQELGLSSEEITALRELRRMRNAIAHDDSAQPELNDAFRFQYASNRLLQSLVQSHPNFILEVDPFD